MARRVVNVLWRHIKAGKVDSCRRCPVALAMRPLMAPQWRAEVYSHEIGILRIDAPPTDQSWAVHYIGLPREAEDFIKNFDLRNTVTPFFFEIEMPDECLL